MCFYNFEKNIEIVETSKGGSARPNTDRSLNELQK